MEIREGYMKQAECLRALASNELRRMNTPIAMDESTRKNFYSAMEAYSRILTVNPWQMEAFLGRCYVWKRLGKLKEALADLDMAISILECERFDIKNHVRFQIESPVDESRGFGESEENYADNESGRDQLEEQHSYAIQQSALWNLKGRLLLQLGSMDTTAEGRKHKEEGLASLLHALRLEDNNNGNSQDLFRSHYVRAYRHVRELDVAVY